MFDSRSGRRAAQNPLDIVYRLWQNLSMAKRASKQTSNSTPSIRVGSARIRLYGRCNEYLGGSSTGAGSACIFNDEADARKEIEILRTSQCNSRAIDSWEIQTLRPDGLWLGCVAVGFFEHPEAA